MPKAVPMHDQWIGLIGEIYGKPAFLDVPLLYYRRHEGTVTGEKTDTRQKVQWREYLIKKLIARVFFGR